MQYMSELVDVRTDALGPGERICIGGAVILVTAVEARGAVVDLHTEYGPALRMLASDLVAVVLEDAADGAGRMTSAA
jgi:hypothetical protein